MVPADAPSDQALSNLLGVRVYVWGSGFRVTCQASLISSSVTIINWPVPGFINALKYEQVQGMPL